LHEYERLSFRWHGDFFAANTFFATGEFIALTMA